MKYDAILFDMDGTLLPMDNAEFTRGYFGHLTQAVSHLGYTKETLIPAMWKGVEAMVRNDGLASNETLFWRVFEGIFGKQVYDHIPHFDKFYHTDFHAVKSLTKPTPLAREIVNLAKMKAGKTVVATNPLFPECAISARLSWANLSPKDFCLVTTYENSHFCKPNPKYYLEICEKIGVLPEKCLMVGNNTAEDIISSAKAGMSTYLVTDCLICEGEMPSCRQGSLADLKTFLEML